MFEPVQFVALRAGVPSTIVRKLVKDGTIPAIKHGNSWLVPFTDAIEVLKREAHESAKKLKAISDKSERDE